MGHEHRGGCCDNATEGLPAAPSEQDGPPPPDTKKPAEKKHGA